MVYNVIVMEDVTKAERQRMLKAIIGGRNVGDQVQILRELKKKGIEATQATISRDLQELGIVKVRLRPGVYHYEIIDTVGEDVLWNKLRILFKNFVLDIKSTGQLLLIKTSPGNANGVASFIDKLEFKEILGTVAGDDTILVVMSTVRNRNTLEKKFAALVEKKQKARFIL